jgi:TonB dependent receptor-like, beta-barrel/Carboxypeptidase regulatory-like domain
LTLGTRRIRHAVLLSLAFAAPSVQAAQSGGGVVGWVEDPRGVPVQGAVVSFFGRGTGGVVTLSDSTGRFFLPALTPGSYTVRALTRSKLVAPPRQITVLPNRDFTFTMSLQEALPGEEATAAETESESKKSAATREINWLLRHKRRSVLEERGQESGFEQVWSVPAPSPSRLLASWIPELDGTVEVMATPLGSGGEIDGDNVPSFSVLRLKGRIAGSGHWTLGGLVSESESTAWRMAAEFVAEPVEGHELQFGTGYGTRFVRPLLPTEGDARIDDRSVGAVFGQDRWNVADSVTAVVGARFSYIGFLEDAHHLDPSLTIEVKRDDHTRLSGTFATRTMAPGGDLLTLTSLATGPAVTYASMERGLRAERSNRIEMAIAQEFGVTTLRAHTFYETVRDQLVNAFEENGGATPTLHILNAGGLQARGMGVTVGRRFGEHVNGQVTYTYGRAWRDAGPMRADVSEGIPLLAISKGDFHDVVARVETVIDETDTRVVALYRVNQLSGTEATSNARRFDVQVSQGLPFLGALTRADWDVLFSIRNLYYEAGEGAILDEHAVSNPPKRVLGGIAVRF